MNFWCDKRGFQNYPEESTHIARGYNIRVIDECEGEFEEEK